MPRRLIDLVVRARRLVTHVPKSQARGRSRVTARRQLGDEVTQFSFRLALVIDLAYVGIGALGGAAVGRASAATAPVTVGPTPSRACPAESVLTDRPSRPMSDIPGVTRSASWLVDALTAPRVQR
jgi:hypothetical protein